jgi:hypothetical protein
MLRGVSLFLLCFCFCVGGLGTAPALAFTYKETVVNEPCDSASGSGWAHNPSGAFRVCEANGNFDQDGNGGDGNVQETAAMTVTFDYDLTNIPSSATVTELVPAVRARNLHFDRKYTEWSYLKVMLGSPANGTAIVNPQGAADWATNSWTWRNPTPGMFGYTSAPVKGGEIVA